MIRSGFYIHKKKNEIYEVLFVARNAEQDVLPMYDIVYMNVKTRKKYTRSEKDFTRMVTIEDYCGPRFVLQNYLDTPIQLFSTTMRMARLEYLRMCQENPLFVQNRANQSFKYMLGDKIAFAQSIRLINTRTANTLIEWLNKWTSEPSTSNEKKRFLPENEELIKDNE